MANNELFEKQQKSIALIRRIGDIVGKDLEKILIDENEKVQKLSKKVDQATNSEECNIAYKMYVRELEIIAKYCYEKY